MKAIPLRNCKTTEFFANLFLVGAKRRSFWLVFGRGNSWAHPRIKIVFGAIGGVWDENRSKESKEDARDDNAKTREKESKKRITGFRNRRRRKKARTEENPTALFRELNYLRENLFGCVHRVLTYTHTSYFSDITYAKRAFYADVFALFYYSSSGACIMKSRKPMGQKNVNIFEIIFGSIK